MPMRRILLAALLGTAVATGAVDAQPAYPTKPVDIVVAFAPGGGADVTARLIAAYASQQWGQPVNVVNMPGASGITGTLRALGARPDGYTLLLEPHATASMLFAAESDVPFKMDGKTPIALVGGHIDFAGQQWSESAGMIAGKKIRALAVVNPTRLPGLPDIPTAAEAGFPNLDVVGWQGLSGPPKLPAPIVRKWAGLLEEASKDPAFLEQALRVNKVIAYKGPEAFWLFQQEELKKYLPLATRMGIRK